MRFNAGKGDNSEKDSYIKANITYIAVMPCDVIWGRTWKRRNSGIR